MNFDESKELERKIFDGFAVENRPFFGSASGLIASRGYLAPRRFGGPPHSAGFSIGIQGSAVCEEGNVCVIGKNGQSQKFHFHLSSDEKVKEEWEWRKANDIRRGNYDQSPQQRLKNLIEEELDESSPTACLLFIPEDGENAWSLGCQIPTNVLEQLFADVVAQRVDKLGFTIEWVEGLRNVRTWGLYTLPDRDAPQPLFGHITSIGWRVVDPTQARQAFASSQQQEDEAKDEFR